MRWLITGGAGFIGSHVVDAILDRGLGDVRVLDNFSRGRYEHLERHLAGDFLEVLDGDIRSSNDVTRASRNVDIVLHLAACSNVMGSESRADEACDTNVAGTMNVLKAASQSGVRRVAFTSSREVYGDPEVLPAREETPIAPKNLYGASKAAGETYCSVFLRRGLDVNILRLANVYGPRDTERVIPIWLERARAGFELEVFGGQQVLDLVWIDHVVEALLRVVLGRVESRVINVASGRGVSIMQVAEWILAATHSTSECVMLPSRQQEVTAFVADITRMKQELGIAPPSLPPKYLDRMLTTQPVGIA